MKLRQALERLRPIARIVPQSWINGLRAGTIHLANRRAQRGIGLPDDSYPAAADRPCRLCGLSSSPHLMLGSLRVTQGGPFSRNSYELLQCTSCDSIYIDPLPVAQDLRLLYEDGVQFSDPLYTDAFNTRNLVSRYRRRFAKLGLYPSSGETLLEVGAGRAWVSRACKEYDAAIQTVAQDVSGECADTCPWVDAYHIGPIQALPPTLTANVISLTHVIEHLPNPAATLTELSYFLSAGGRLYITAPFRPALWKPEHGFEAWRRYSYMHVPAHLQYLSQRWFESWCNHNRFEIEHWDNSQDARQAFEAVLTRVGD